jgi:hypothetical protein
MAKRLKQDKLMIKVRQRLKADGMVLSHTDENGFQCYVKKGKQAKPPTERCVLCGHVIKEGK